MEFRMWITQATANYFLANNVKFTQVETDKNGNHVVEVKIESGMDVYNIFDAGRSYGRDLKPF